MAAAGKTVELFTVVARPQDEVCVQLLKTADVRQSALDRATSYCSSRGCWPPSSCGRESHACGSRN